MNWYLDVLKKYAVFSGRARRKEYWMFILFNLIVSIVLAVADLSLGSPLVLYYIYSLAVLLPSLAVSVRRLHDTDRSGWWMLLMFLPIVGPIVLFIFFLFDSSPQENKHGANPKAVAA